MPVSSTSSTLRRRFGAPESPVLSGSSFGIGVIKAANTVSSLGSLTSVSMGIR